MISLRYSGTTSGGKRDRRFRNNFFFIQFISYRAFVKPHVPKMLRALANSTVYLHMPSLILIILTVIRYNPSAYNINTHEAEVFHDPARASGGRGNYFGFSVALYVGANESLLLVGAPRANSSKLPSVTEPGTIFKCWNGVCGEWPIDQTNGSYTFNKLNLIQIKDYAWIGATIAVENKTRAKVVVCHCLLLR